jgi:capsular polysaccharide transport system permease protein
MQMNDCEIVGLMAGNRYVEILRPRARVIAAIMLRDIRTRYGGIRWNYAVAIAWPLSHLVGMVIVFTFVNRMIPFGTNSVVFVSTGALPYVLCLYPARLSALAFMQGRQLLAFPIIQPIDVILARVVLEALSACLVATLFCLGLWAFGVDLMPQDLPTALTGVYAAIFFGISLGVFTIILSSIFGTPGYLAMILGMIVLYMSSGVYMPMYGSSEQARFWISLNPLVHLVEWVRSGYYEMYMPAELDKKYIICLASILLFGGLAGERLFRGKILR